jgi:glutamate N-acetyltransferase/amino-acid N-acetyltransferase
MAVGDGRLPQFRSIPGVKIGVVEAGIKHQNRKDLVLFELKAGGTLAGVFTKNAFCAAPVQIAKQHLSTSDSNKPRYLLINTGNANAGTGPRGFDDALACCQKVAAQQGLESSQVLPFSTGVIGETLLSERITASVPQLVKTLEGHAWPDAAAGIMTTDTRPKGASRSVNYDGHEIVISGISKGAGMIMPNMATMLCFVATNAKVAQPLLQSLLSELADKSFNRITVDGDTSTNDACMLMASGECEAPEIDSDHPDFLKFKASLQAVMIELAQAIVKDGEGATKFVTVAVEEASSVEEALETAYTIAHSPLIKTALFASDPNWGRILAALGRAPLADLDLFAVRIYLNDVLIVEQGARAESYTEAQGQSVMDQDEITITLRLARGVVSEQLWTCDLSHDYVTINAEYRT